MSWKIVYSAHAKNDLADIYEYIAFSLKEPETAKKQVRSIMSTIRTLDEMPMRFRLYDDEPWRSQGLRFVAVGNYLIFYLPLEPDNTVSIVRIMYGGRDIGNRLDE